MRELTFRYHDQVINNQQQSTILCGIVNVTPDSFSDGGQWYGKEAAIAHAQDLIKQGATMLDIGGESTRPGSHYVQVQEEIDRVVPVIKALKEITDIPLSIDTWKADVAEAAIAAGVDIVNDITGCLGDPRMAEVIGASTAGVILMFNPVIARPDHPGSSVFPSFGGEGVFSADELAQMAEMEITDLMHYYFQRAIDICHQHGIADERIMLDPGIGFGLTKRENLTLINNIDVIREMGYFTFLGVSRKRFIQSIADEAGFNVDVSTPEGFGTRDEASAALTTIAALKGVEVVRIHTLQHHRLASTIADSVRLADQMADQNFKAYAH